MKTKITEHDAWKVEARARRRQSRRHFVFSLLLTAAVAPSIIYFFVAFGSLGILPALLAVLTWAGFVFPAVHVRGNLLILVDSLAAATSDQKYDIAAANRRLLRHMARDLPDFDRIGADPIYARQVFRRRMRRAVILCAALVSAAILVGFGLDRADAAASLKFCLITGGLAYVFVRQSNGWTVNGLMRQNRERAALIRAEIGEEDSL